MPDVTLNQFRQVDTGRQVSINPDNQNQLNTDGERHVFLGRLVDKITRTSEQRESYRTATKTFIDLVKQEYGERIGNWATRELSEHVEKGKPLTGYRIEKILAKAEEAVQIQRTELDRYLDVGVAKLVNEEIEALENKGVEVDESVKEHMLGKARDFVRGCPEFQNPALLQRSMEETFGAQLREGMSSGLELLSKGLERAREVSENKEGTTLNLSKRETITRFLDGMGEQISLYGQELEEGGIERRTPEFAEAMKDRLEVLLGKAYIRIVNTDDPKKIKEYGEAQVLKMDAIREAVDGLEHLSTDKKEKLAGLFDRMEDLRNEVFNLRGEHCGDLGYLLDISTRLGEIREEFKELRPKFSEKEARKEWDTAMESVKTPNVGDLEDQLIWMQKSIFRALNLPEMIKMGSEVYRVGSQLELLGRWGKELQNPESPLLRNPVSLAAVIKKLSEMEGIVEGALQEVGQNSTLRLILQDLKESLRFSMEAIRDRQGPMVDLLLRLDELKFDDFKLKEYSKVQGSTQSREIGMEELEKILDLLQKGAEPYQLSQLGKQGKSIEEISQEMIPIRGD